MSYQFALKQTFLNLLDSIIFSLVKNENQADFIIYQRLSKEITKKITAPKSLDYQFIGAINSSLIMYRDSNNINYSQENRMQISELIKAYSFNVRSAFDYTDRKATLYASYLRDLLNSVISKNQEKLFKTDGVCHFDDLYSNISSIEVNGEFYCLPLSELEA